jgi:UDP-N-acetylglucosamine 4,6-dehydratase/5-epimerase
MGILDNKSVLITGGTGSFGKAFVRKVLKEHDVKRLVIYSRDELKQFDMQQEFDGSNIRYFLGDVRDEKRLERALSGIDTIVHAAAMKQVVASEYNPIECILTNVIGAENVINASLNTGVKHVIALSTDKAVNPLNLYGATKLCSDKLFISANNMSGANGCVFSVVRYGNVIGSRGSVVPVFQKQLSTGKLTITDERMTRFWLTLEQSTDFVISSLGRMIGGEIFVPKIPSMKIIDLAKTMGPDCEIEVIGIRPGEKLHEILIPRDEMRNTYEFDSFVVVRPAFNMRSSDTDAHTEYDGVKGRLITEDFEYDSGNNNLWVSRDHLLQIINQKN